MEEVEEGVVIVDNHAMTCRAIEVKYNAINAKKYTHIKADCWFKDTSMNNAEENEVSKLFMAFKEAENSAGSVWHV